MVSQILSAVEDKRPLLWFLPLWVDAMWILAWSFAGGILTLYLMPSPKRLGLTGTVALISLNGICLVVLLTNGCILPLVPSLLALVATGGSMVARGTFQPQKPQ
jgi:CHASE2 domain-containing sensor protein